MWTPGKRALRGLQRVVDEPKQITRSKVMAILVSKKEAKFRLLSTLIKTQCRRHPVTDSRIFLQETKFEAG